MKVTLDLTKLLEEGRITREEHDRLATLGAAGTGSLAFNILLGFGVAAVSGGAVALVPDAITGNPGQQGCGPPGIALPGPTGCYPYREPLPAPPPGGPPPGPPAVAPPGVATTPVPSVAPVQLPAPGQVPAVTQTMGPLPGPAAAGGEAGQ